MQEQNELLFDLSTLSDIKLTRLKAGKNPYYDLEYYRERPRLFVTENFRQQIYKKYKLIRPKKKSRAFCLICIHTYIYIQ